MHYRLLTAAKTVRDAVGFANSELARGAHLVTIVATPEGYIAVVADEPDYRTQ